MFKSKWVTSTQRVTSCSWLNRLGKHPNLVVNSAVLALRVGRDYKQLQNGAFSKGEFRARASGHVAGITLGMGGAALGTTLGSVVPGIGSALGGFAGSLIGDYAGTRIGNFASRNWAKRSNTR
ncbi:MAG: hypothetical protein VYC39_13710 [Myxococcota bacterium]|nr:hypothetical protein [Myxococcota bacterium]